MTYPHKKHYRSRPTRRAKTGRPASPPVGTWLALGMLIGILGSVAVYQVLSGQWSLGYLKEKHKVLKTSPTKKDPGAEADAAANTAQAEAYRFEFYQLLPGMEVPIQDPTVEATTTPLKTIPAAPTSTAVATTAPAATPEHSLETEDASTEMAPEKTNRATTASTKQSTPLPVEQAVKKAKTQIKVAAPQYLIQTGAYRTLAQADALRARLVSQGFSPRIQKIEAEDGIWYRVIVGPFPSETMALSQKNRLAKHHIQGILILQRR